MLLLLVPLGLVALGSHRLERPGRSGMPELILLLLLLMLSRARSNLHHGRCERKVSLQEAVHPHAKAPEQNCTCITNPLWRITKTHSLDERHDHEEVVVSEIRLVAPVVILPQRESLLLVAGQIVEYKPSARYTV